jgi:hypothetical protein
MEEDKVYLHDCHIIKSVNMTTWITLNIRIIQPRFNSVLIVLSIELSNQNKKIIFID